MYTYADRLQDYIDCYDARIEQYTEALFRHSLGSAALPILRERVRINAFWREECQHQLDAIKTRVAINN